MAQFVEVESGKRVDRPELPRGRTTAPPGPARETARRAVRRYLCNSSGRFGDVGGDAPGLVAGEELSRRALQKHASFRVLHG